MIHIGIDASRTTHAQPTGVEWYARHIISHLIEQQPQQWVYHLYAHHTPSIWPTTDRVRPELLHWPLRRFWTVGRLSWEMLRRPPDLLFIPSHVAPPLTPSRVVVTIHDVGWRRWPQLYTSQQRWYLEASTRRAVARATRILTISEFTKNELVTEFKCPASRIHVTPLGIDHHLYQPTTTEQQNSIRTRLHLPPQYVLFVGRQDHKKNINGLLDAWAQLHPHTNIALVFVGPSGNATGSIAHHQQQPYGKSIYNLGWQDERDLHQIYAAATTLVLPSFYEGFGLPLIQAQACGVPVITSDSGAMAEVTPNGALHIDPLKSKDIANAIHTMLFSTPTHKKLAHEAIRNAAAFTWQHTARLTTKTFAELVQFIV